ncbi:hypothetical protein F5Y14DRAFT_404121 [Nemania sp. NC0429]|nr:hypothetical protein F5Y14DRAFT_404121 [Nemania sp. NC0429]
MDGRLVAAARREEKRALAYACFCLLACLLRGADAWRGGRAPQDFTSHTSAVGERGRGGKVKSGQQIFRISTASSDVTCVTRHNDTTARRRTTHRTRHTRHLIETVRASSCLPRFASRLDTDGTVVAHARDCGTVLRDHVHILSLERERWGK